MLLQFEVLRKIIPRQVKAEKAVSVIRKTVEELIVKCKEIVEAEGERIDGSDEYVNDADPSILRFLLASREEVCCILLLTYSMLFLLSLCSYIIAKFQDLPDIRNSNVHESHTGSVCRLTIVVSLLYTMFKLIYLRCWLIVSL